MAVVSGGDEFVDKSPDEAVIIKASFPIAFVSLSIGASFGLIQALHHTNVFRVIDSADYCTVLMGHGVLLAIVFIIFFLYGVLHWAVARSLDRPAESTLFSWAWVDLMTTGAVLATVAILGGPIPNLGMSTDVLFTFYAPLQAHPIFYIGLVMFIVGTWLAGADWFLSYRAWRQEHPDERIPLQTFMVLTTTITWYIFTLGVAVSVVFSLIPWSLGLIEDVNPLLTRTLFQYFGHLIVCFRLMSAYLLWYTMLPKLAGGRLFSDPLARVVPVLFLLLSAPVGIHHQYLDPGIAEGFKFIAMTSTMFLLLLSLLTTFTVVASVEHGARQRGGEGYLRWLDALPWRDPAFTGMALVGTMFATDGFSGMINAGMNTSYLIHNTLWVPGHFYLTVGTAVVLTMMAGSYWLVPQVTGRKLYSRPIDLLQIIMWLVGMVFMSDTMHRAGLAGIPRRTAEPQYQNFEFLTPIGSIFELRVQIVLGGTFLFLLVMLFLLNILLTSLGEESDRPIDSYLPEPFLGPEGSPCILNNLMMWTGIAAVLAMLAHALPLAGIIQNGGGLFDGGPLVPATVSAGVDLVLTTVTSAFDTLWGVAA